MILGPGMYPVATPSHAGHGLLPPWHRRRSVRDTPSLPWDALPT